MGVPKARDRMGFMKNRNRNAAQEAEVMYTIICIRSNSKHFT